MSIKINGVTVAGVGRPGTSAYESAKKGGFTGTEQAFNQALADISNKDITLKDLTFTGGASAVYNGSTATSIAIPTKLPNPNSLTFTGAVSGTYDGSTALTVNIPEVDDNGEVVIRLDTTLTQSGVAADAKAVGDRINGINPQIWHAGTTPPTNANLLWIDTSIGNGILKYLPTGLTNTKSNWKALSAIYS